MRRLYRGLKGVIVKKIKRRALREETGSSRFSIHIVSCLAFIERVKQGSQGCTPQLFRCLLCLENRTGVSGLYMASSILPSLFHLCAAPATHQLPSIYFAMNRKRVLPFAVRRPQQPLLLAPRLTATTSR